MSPDAVCAAMGRLRKAGVALRARPRAEVLDALCALFDSWRDPTSPWRRRLERELPEVAGFSAPAVREGLARGLEGWTGDALRRLVQRELPQGGDAAATRVGGFDLTAVVLAGSIPMPSLLQMVLPLLLGSPVLAKAASRDPLTPRTVAESLYAIAPDFADSLEVVDFGRREDCAAALCEADCLVVSGSDETLAGFGRRLAPWQRLVGYGHRLSVAAVGPGAVLEEVCPRLALDVALWDQLGCLSPVAVYASGDRTRAGQVAEALAEALSLLERRLPAGPLPVQAAADVAAERSGAELRAASGRAVSVRGAADLRWTVVLEDDTSPRPRPLHRFVRVHPVDGVHALLAALRPFGRYLASVAVEGFGGAADLAGPLAQLGTSRVCAPGAMQAPPLGWRHDGQPLLLPLARFCDVETR